MKRALVGVGGLVCCGVLGWAYHVQSAARQELLGIRAALAPGMTRADAVGAIRQRTKLTRLVPGGAEDPNAFVTEGGSPGAWVLSVSFGNGHVVAVRVGTEDSLFQRPTGAPPDLVWGTEPSGSPWRPEPTPLQRR